MTNSETNPVSRLLELDEPFTQNGNRGPFEGPAYEYIDRGSSTLLVGLHSVIHSRDGRDKEQDDRVGGYVRLLGEETNSSTFVVLRALETLESWEVRKDEVKFALDAAIDKASKIFDIHGMRDRAMDICIGQGPSPTRQDKAEALGLLKHLRAEQISATIDVPFAGAQSHTLVSYISHVSEQKVALQIELSRRSRFFGDKSSIKIASKIFGLLKEYFSVNNFEVHETRKVQLQEVSEVVCGAEGSKPGEWYLESSHKPPRRMYVEKIPLCEQAGQLETNHIRLNEHARKLLNATPKSRVTMHRDVQSKDAKSAATFDIARFFEQRVFGAPEIYLLESQASSIDENQKVVRVSSEIFPLLGVAPGDKVVIQFGHRKATAIAQDFPDSEALNQDDGLRNSISLPLAIRIQLDMDNRDWLGVVKIRRSIWGLQGKYAYKHVTVLAAVFLFFNGDDLKTIFDASMTISASSSMAAIGLGLLLGQALMILTSRITKPKLKQK